MKQLLLLGGLALGLYLLCRKKTSSADAVSAPLTAAQIVERIESGRNDVLGGFGYNPRRGSLNMRLPS